MNLEFDLNTKQRKAVTTTEGPVLVLAGPGSGKSRSLTYRIAYLIKQGINPAKIMVMTFTNKAANDMTEKVENLLDDKEIADKLWIGTFHGMGVKILTKHLNKFGYGNNFLIYDQKEAGKLIKRIKNKMNLSSELYETSNIQNVISNQKMKLNDPDDLYKNYDNEFYHTIADIYKEYQKRLKKDSAFDFDDLIKKPLDLFNRNPDIKEKYQERFEYLLIDEYQDSNHSQYKFATTIAEPHNNIFVVGDDFQSIYGFRGADISNILNFEKDYPNVETIKLERNYRSANNIVKASNYLIKNNENQTDKDVWTNQENTAPVIVAETTREETEAEFVVNNIKNFVNMNEYNYKDIAILYRCNYQSRVFENELIQANIPHQVLGSLSFFDRMEIKDILAFLNIMSNKNSFSSLARVVDKMINGLGSKTLDRIYEYAAERDLTLFDILQDKDLTEISGIGSKTSDTIDKFTKYINKIVSIGNDISLSIPEKIQTVLEECGYMDYLEKNHDNLDDRIQNIEEFIRLSRNYYNKDELRGIPKFLQDIKLMSDQEEMDEDDDTVKLMTAHSSKGLEFPVVFLVGMEEDSFPFELAVEENGKQGVEEERRLCYVAMTRAEERLYLSYKQYKKSRFGNFYEEQTPSQFIKELPETQIKLIRKTEDNYNAI